MLVDWFTVAAQALNFLILVWLMKRFLFKPVLGAIDEREKEIAARVADAAKGQSEAQAERTEFERKNQELDQQRAALLSRATEEVAVERERLLSAARQAADALTSKRQEALRNDARELDQAIRRRAQKEVFLIARQALSDLANTSLEERMGEIFTRRLREMEAPAKASLGAALAAATEPAILRSAIDLPSEQRATIQNALNETFSAEVQVRFQTAPDLVSGIELTVNGQRVGWNISNYLSSIAKGVDELVTNSAGIAAALGKGEQEAKAK